MCGLPHEVNMPPPRWIQCNEQHNIIFYRVLHFVNEPCMFQNTAECFCFFSRGPTSSSAMKPESVPNNTEVNVIIRPSWADKTTFHPRNLHVCHQRRSKHHEMHTERCGMNAQVDPLYKNSWAQSTTTLWCTISIPTTLLSTAFYISTRLDDG